MSHLEQLPIQKKASEFERVNIIQSENFRAGNALRGHVSSVSTNLEIAALHLFYELLEIISKVLHVCA